MWLFRTWIPLAIVVTGVCALTYVSVQQISRQSLNDPQVQMAEDGASLLRATKAPAALVDRNAARIDIANNLASWIAVFDVQGMTLESNATLDNAPVHPPLSVLQAAQSGGKDTDQPNENRVTWQPRAGVRQAIVIVWVPEMQEYVVAGRNMREGEGRSQNLAFLAASAWLSILVVTFGVSAIGNRKAS